MQERTDGVTGLLRAWRAGEGDAGDRLLATIYSELKRLAAAQLRGERGEHTLQATALVNEAFLRLIDQRGVDWRDRAHFFGLASTMMRRVLVDHARARTALKRSAPEGEPLTVALEAIQVEVLDLDRALERLATSFPRQPQPCEFGSNNHPRAIPRNSSVFSYLHRDCREMS